MFSKSMELFHVSLWLPGLLLHVSAKFTPPTSEFQLKGDYLLGGLFNLHYVSNPVFNGRPEALDCSRQSLLLPSYRSFLVMRFAVEEINNSTTLLPNVSLGYEIFDHCSDTGSFPGIFELISVNGLIQPWGKQVEQQAPKSNESKVVAVVGPFTSTHALTVAPLFMVDLIPVVSYGASISVLSKKVNFPSFLRTVHPNKDVIEVIVYIMQHFNWSWVAFLNSDDAFGSDGLELFINRIKDTQICLAYTQNLNDNTNYSRVFKQIEAQRISVIIVFAPKLTVQTLIGSAIQQNITKVWIADDGWSLNTEIRQMKGITNIGTVLGVSQPTVTIPGFQNFVYSSRRQDISENAAKQNLCNQICNCSALTPEGILSVDPSFLFAVYSAVYTAAYALHEVLQCKDGSCNKNVTVYPHMVLAELKMSNFTLLNERIQFDENGDPNFGSYSIIFWNDSGAIEEIGHYDFQPSVTFFINSTKVQWYTEEDVPSSVCSPECLQGNVKKQNGVHKCCFTCEICPSDTYINSTGDPYTCLRCEETEWSQEGSTSCNLRRVEYITFTDTGAVVLMVGACVFMVLTLATSVLFAVNYNTPVVRSAGGLMCFLILGCLSLSTLSVFFYFGKPTTGSCILRLLPFLLFYTVCLACFVVRSFQIVCVFKMASRFPKLYGLWMKYHGQWLLITGAFCIQMLLLLIGYSYELPKPRNETLWYPDKTLLVCSLNLKSTAAPVILLTSLCSLCFIFSYMGKDLPKNYNEAKAITFCLLLLILTWIIFATVSMLYRDLFIITFNALAVLSSLYSFLLWYFLPKCYIIIFQPFKNTQQYFQGLIQNYTKTISQ